jgi:hypothetical protein
MEMKKTIKNVDCFQIDEYNMDIMIFEPGRRMLLHAKSVYF